MNKYGPIYYNRQTGTEKMEELSLIQKIVIYAPPIVFAIVCHEVAHGYVAYKCNDSTAKMMGRLTLNPIKHIDPVGTVLLPLFLLATGVPVFGYAKPVPVNPFNFNKLRRDNLLVSAAGPVTNIVLAWISIVLAYIVGLLLGAFGVESVLWPISKMLDASIIINVWLAAFNLMPIPPLDGGHILESILPDHLAKKYDKVAPYGFIILIILIFSRLYRYIAIPFAIAIQYVLHFTADVPMQWIIGLFS